ncbi:RNA polymerase sigma factor [Lacticaseibacillus yichunensis]|uniref:RNA polymerase sigma factor n=1 Tax=Lacticaseibacillus yichunensis TaxID=2486015 RepID=A0ABW4CQI7_9LACO|nr:sigma factor-like helix-turn-helix DNA-binding protein [Lacticaseibacillus yichunensis]
MAGEVKRYTVLNEAGEFLETDNLLLLPAWTTDLQRMWLTYSRVEATRVAKQADGTACVLTFTPLVEETEDPYGRGLPVAVQRQAITLHEQGLTYRQIAKLLSISKSTVGNIIHRK